MLVVGRACGSFVSYSQKQRLAMRCEAVRGCAAYSLVSETAPAEMCTLSVRDAKPVFERRLS